MGKSEPLLAGFSGLEKTLSQWERSGWPVFYVVIQLLGLKVSFASILQE
jgi:hypothetical protein